MGKLFDPQGQVTPKWIVWFRRNWNSYEIFRLSLLPASMRNIRSKMKSLSIRQHFHYYKYMGANFQHSRASNIKVNTLIWPKFKLIWEFMAVLATWKFDEDPIKLKGTIDQTMSNMGFFDSQGQVTPKWKSLIWTKFELIQEFMAVLVTCKFDEDPIKTECTINRTRSNMGFFSTQGQVTLTWIVWCG